jgi:hypothetical protein
MSLQHDVRELEGFLEEQDYLNKYCLSILAGDTLVFPFIAKFLQDQGYDILSFDFEEFNHLGDTPAEDYFHEKTQWISEQCSHLTRPIIYISRFSSTDTRYKHLVLEWLEKGISIDDNHSFSYCDENGADRFIYAPVVIGSNSYLDNSFENVQNHIHIVNYMNLRNCTWLQAYADSEEKKREQGYREIEKKYQPESRVVKNDIDDNRSSKYNW